MHPVTEWQPISSAPKDGTRIKALVETELVWDEPVPAALIGGWRRVADHDRIVGWLPSPPSAEGD